MYVHSLNFINNSQAGVYLSPYFHWYLEVLYLFVFSLFLKKILNWRIIGLPCCSDFCCTTMQISHNCIYIYILSFLSLPPPSHRGSLRRSNARTCSSHLCLFPCEPHSPGSTFPLRRPLMCDNVMSGICFRIKQSLHAFACVGVQHGE